MCNENLYHYEFYALEKEKLRMQVSYMKLQKLMIENQMKRNDLMRAAEISGTTTTKINKNEPYRLKYLCVYVRCFIVILVIYVKLF